MQEHKDKLVQSGAEGRLKESGFTDRIKKRWVAQYSGNDHTAQNLINNTRKFKKEGYTHKSEKNTNNSSEPKSIASWTINFVFLFFVCMFIFMKYY